MTDDGAWVHAGKQITGAQRRLLQVIADTGDSGIRARAAAAKLWPQSESWGHATHRGDAVLTGQGAQMRVGTMIADLHRAKLIVKGGVRAARWRVSPAGREFLGSAEAVDEGQGRQGRLL